MNKKKLVSLCLVLALVLTAVIGGTMAYFTDTDSADNTFTTAKVDIQLNEQQRNEAGTALEPFVAEDAKMLFPIVGSAQGEKDNMGLPVAENYVDKIITIKNLDGSTDAYVRLYIAIPSVLDNVKNAGQNILHFNWGNKFTYGDYSAADHDEFWGAETLLVQDFDIDGTDYNIYYRDYNKVLGEDTETGSAAYVGFYMDSKVDYDTENNWYTIDGVKINYDFSEGVTIPVFAVGVQEAGFGSAKAAVDAAFGANFNPWAK